MRFVCKKYSQLKNYVWIFFLVSLENLLTNLLKENRILLVVLLDFVVLNRQLNEIIIIFSKIEGKKTKRKFLYN